MTAPIKKLPFLVVSSSPYMRGILKFVLETMLHTEVTELESEEKALSFLKNLQSAPSMIVYDYTPNAYLLEDFVGYLRDNSKLVRIVILVDKIREEGKELLKDQHQMLLMDESHLPGNLVEESKHLFSGSPYLNEEQYCRIDINFLSILDGINKNLFIKIGTDKFIKLFHEDDNTNILDIKKYKSKGIDYLYLNRETAMWVINQIQNQIDIFLKANNFRFVLRGASDSPEKRFENKILRIDDEVHVDKDFNKLQTPMGNKSVAELKPTLEILYDPTTDIKDPSAAQKADEKVLQLATKLTEQGFQVVRTARAPVPATESRILDRARADLRSTAVLAALDAAAGDALVELEPEEPAGFGAQYALELGKRFFK